MKTTKNVDKKIQTFHKKLAKCLDTDEKKLSAFSSCLGYSELMGLFILEGYDLLKIPNSVKYALVQHLSMRCLVSKILNDEISKPDEFKTVHMPTTEGAWDSEEDFEKRFIFVVDQYYKSLKKEGKI